MTVVAATAGLASVARSVAFRANARLPIVTGAAVQNGWMLDGSFAGHQDNHASEAFSGIAGCLQRFFNAEFDSNADFANWSPAYVGPRLRSPASISIPYEINSKTHLTITGQLSDGRIVPLSCHVRRWPGPLLQFAVYPAIPAAAEDCAWMDVQVKSDQNMLAVWRVHDLQRLFHRSLGATSTGPINLGKGATVSGSAVWAPDLPRYTLTNPSVYNGRLPVKVDLALYAPPDQPGHHTSWHFDDLDLTQEWDISSTIDGKSDPPCVVYPNKPDNRVTLLGFGASRPEEQRAVEAHGHATEFDEFDETVTFKNVPVVNRNDGWEILLPAQGLVLRTANGPSLSLRRIDDSVA